MLEAKDVMKILPHRYPFLFVDRVLELEPGKRAVGIKNVTANEPHFTGHWPGNPVMPGVLILEAMAQVGGILLLTVADNEGMLAMFGGVDGLRFRRPVLPGDQLRIETELVRVKGRVGKCRAVATVDGEVAAEAELLFALTEDEQAQSE